MSLNTLLEAAQFLETSNDEDPKARDVQATEFHHYAKPAISPGSQVKALRRLSPKQEGDGKLRPYDGASLREVHNKLEKNRRAHLKECFDNLWNQIPHGDLQKTSNLNILRCALRFIQLVKRQDKEQEKELQELAQAKIASQQRIKKLQDELADMNVQVDLSKFTADGDGDDHSVSTMTAEDVSPIMSEDEDESRDLVTEDVKQEDPDSLPAKSKWEIKTMAARKQIPAFIAEVQANSSATISAPVTLSGSEVSSNALPQISITPNSHGTGKQHVSKILQQTITERQKALQKLVDKPLTTMIAQPPVALDAQRPVMTIQKQPVAALRSGVTLNQVFPTFVPAASLIASTQTPTLTTNTPIREAPATTVAVVNRTNLATTSSISNGQVLTANVGGIKHVITPISAIPASQILSPAHLSAISQLIQPQQQQLGTSTASPAQPSVVLTTPSSTQIVPPLAVIAPSASPGLGTAQVLRIPIGSIPLIPQYTMPLKPMVVVTMPKVVPTASATVTAVAKTTTS